MEYISEEYEVAPFVPIKRRNVDYYKILKETKIKRKKKQMEGKPLVMPVGKYAGVAIDKLPLSYCRWIVSQKFDEDILKAAKRKVDQSLYSKHDINVSRHAIDMFSIRHIELWINRGTKTKIGLGTFLAELAEEAWNKGLNISKERYEDDGIIKLYKDIKFVFSQNEMFPQFKELVTVM